MEDDVENEVAEPAATSNHKRESSLRNAENKVAESPEKKVPEPGALEKLEEKVPESLGNSPKLVLGREGLGADGLSDKEPCCLPSPRRNQKAANLENKRIEPFSPVPTYNITQSREEEATVKETEVETENYDSETEVETNKYHREPVGEFDPDCWLGEDANNRGKDCFLLLNQC